MIIEIRNAGFENKGAELMLRTIMQVMGENNTYVMNFNLNSAPYEKRARLGIYQKSGIVKFGFHFDWFLGLMPSRLLNMLGIIRNKDVDVVLDASGFAYGEPWDNNALKNAYISSCLAKKYNQKFIFLPQCFGEFHNTKDKNIMSKTFGNSTLVFARDNTSFSNIKNLIEANKVFQARDFTNLLTVERDYKQVNDCVVVIPNCRMLDKANGEQYLSLINNIIKILLDKKQKIVLLNHEGKDDLELCKSLSKKWGNLHIIDGKNAIEVKNIIGSSKAVVSSRFHGIVSSLSQGLVTIGTSWSHKYKALYDDYDFNEGLIDDMTIDESALEKKLLMICDDKIRTNFAEKIAVKSDLLKLESIETWDKIKSELSK